MIQKSGPFQPEHVRPKAITFSVIGPSQNKAPQEMYSPHLAEYILSIYSLDDVYNQAVSVMA
jgi:hypothetical protein